jgi:amidase
VLRQAYERPTTDPEIERVFMAAVEDLRKAGATIVDPAIVDLATARRQQGADPCGGFKYDMNRYLAGHGDRVPVKSVAEIIKSRRFHPSIQLRLERLQEGPENGPRPRRAVPKAPTASRCAPRC